VGIKPLRKKGQILQHLNTDKRQRNLETGGHISRNMLHQVLLPQNLLEIQDVAKQQKIKYSSIGSVGFLEADSCGEGHKGKKRK